MSTERYSTVSVFLHNVTKHTCIHVFCYCYMNYVKSTCISEV